MRLDKNLIELLDDKDYADRVNVYYANELVGIVLADAVEHTVRAFPRPWSVGLADKFSGIC